MASYQITVPLPPKEASPNFHPASIGARMKQATAIRMYREQCGVIMCSANANILAIECRVAIHLDFYLARPLPWKGYREGLYYPRDADNARASAKAAQDALVDAGIIKGDSARYVDAGYTRLHTTQKEHQGRAELVITLEELPCSKQRASW